MYYTAQTGLFLVEDVPDGLLVRLHAATLGRHNAHDLAEELVDVAFHRGGPNLYLDFREVLGVSEYVVLRLVVLHWKLQSMGDRLVLLNLRPEVYEAVRAARLADLLNIRDDSPSEEFDGGA